jgi:copper(I)-binding protein
MSARLFTSRRLTSSTRPGTPGRRHLPTVALSVVALVALAGCSSAESAPSGAGSAATGSAADSVSVDDPWVKAADSGMSAAFGEITNSGSEDVTVVSVTTPASTTLELHETVENESGSMVMREKDGGFTVPAGGDLVLAPGGNHIMLMDLVEPVVAGDEVTFTLTFSDESTLDFTAPAKDYAGANESYEGGDDMEGTESMEGMDHGDMDHGDSGDATTTPGATDAPDAGDE